MPALSAWAAGSAESPALRLERFVADARFREAVEVGLPAAARGVPMSTIAGDLTDLWFEELDLLWKKTPQALAGVTTRQGLFVLETLAADRRMQVVYRGEHRSSTGNGVEHVLSGPAGLLARATHTDGSSWEARLGRAMLECPVGKPAAGKLELTTPAGRAGPRDEALFSWIIAPRTAVALRA
jgi:hypothetical protein